MYHAHRYSRNAWAGEPEIDPTMDYEEREQVEGWEMTPYECLDLAYGGVLREKFVQAGECGAYKRERVQNERELKCEGCRVKYGLYRDVECVLGDAPVSKVCQLHLIPHLDGLLLPWQKLNTTLP